MIRQLRKQFFLIQKCFFLSYLLQANEANKKKKKTIANFLEQLSSRIISI